MWCGILYACFAQAKPPELPNLGVSCYLNAFIQVTYNIPDFVTLLINNKLLFNNNTPQDFLVSNYCAVLENIKNNRFKNEPINETYLTLLYKSFDAAIKHNWLTLETIESYDINYCNQQAAAEPWGILLNSLAFSEKENKTIEQNLFIQKILDLFNIGEHAVITDQAGQRSEPKNDLLVTSLSIKEHIPSQPLVTLSELIEEHVSPQSVTLTGYFKPTKQLFFIKPADYFLLELKNVIFEGGRYVKYSMNIAIPPLLTMPAVWFNDEKESTDYELIGVTIHAGGTSGGHYTAYIKDQYDPPHPWYYCNDSSIEKIGERLSPEAQQHINTSASFLVYKRVGKAKILNDQDIKKKLQDFNKYLSHLKSYVV